MQHYFKQVPVKYSNEIALQPKSRHIPDIPAFFQSWRITPLHFLKAAALPLHANFCWCFANTSDIFKIVDGKKQQNISRGKALWWYSSVVVCWPSLVFQIFNQKREIKHCLCIQQWNRPQTSIWEQRITLQHVKSWGRDLHEIFALARSYIWIIWYP